MKQLTINGKVLGVVDVPDRATNLIIVKDQLRYKTDPLKYWWDLIKLPHGQWSILGRLNDITEEQAAGLVGKVECGDNVFRFINYTGDYGKSNSEWFGCFAFDKATESLQSFFRSHGIEGNPLIILNEKV